MVLIGKGWEKTKTPFFKITELVYEGHLWSVDASMGCRRPTVEIRFDFWVSELWVYKYLLRVVEHYTGHPVKS